MAWATVGSVTIDPDAVETALTDWENDNSPSSIDGWRITKQGPNRCLITIQYTA